MKYICLGYYNEKKWETMSESERNALMDECFAYDEVLRKNGHCAGGEALQGARDAERLFNVRARQIEIKGDLIMGNAVRQKEMR